MRQAALVVLLLTVSEPAQRLPVISQAGLEKREKLVVPQLRGRADVASATTRPWIDANGWRFLRKPQGKFYYDLPAGKAALAAAEAFAYNADVILKIDPADREEAARMLAFLRKLAPATLPPAADIAVIDDGSREMGEVLNLLVRRNLLFRLTRAPLPQFRINLKLGDREFPRNAAADPSEFVLRLRRQLTDEERTLRIYGTEMVLCRLLRDGQRARLHLLNYSGRPIDGVRVRLRGTYAKAEAVSFGVDQAATEDFIVADDTTEFSLPLIGVYTVVDLRK